MKVQEGIVFTAKHGEWTVAEKLKDMEGEGIARFLGRVANTVNHRIPLYLKDVMNVEGITALAREFDDLELADAVITLKSTGTARKLGALVHEEDRKLRKLLVDVAKALLVREVLSKKVSVEYPGGVIKDVKTGLPYREDHINFVAFHVKTAATPWRVVKRLIIDDKTPMADVARLLASINESITLKIPVYAGIDVEGITDYLGGPKKVKKAGIRDVVEALQRFPADDYAPEGFAEHARVYALRKALEKIGLPLDVPAKSLEKYLEKK
ncbi:DUF2666 family protein [Thermococcus sp.]|uniref:DUF2666 family protein n=1 Tax=Thermococcus sp. TaxID=35749 RepID=UPI0026244A01|nr:DUF2666 family protein [Thermococcus sp.]